MNFIESGSISNLRPHVDNFSISSARNNILMPQSSR